MRRLVLGLLVFASGSALVSASPVGNLGDLLRTIVEHPVVSPDTAAFGQIEQPAAGQTVFGFVTVSGFVLDINSVSNIKLYIDGSYVNTADINLPRYDVLLRFPTYANSPTAKPGFTTSFFAGNFSNGHHTLKVVATESADPSHPATIGEISVTVDNSINQSPFGDIDVPANTPGTIEEAGSAYTVYGWALDDKGIDHVELLVDDLVIEGAVCCNTNAFGDPDPRLGATSSTGLYGVPRPDIEAAYPDAVVNGLHLSLFSGFEFNLDTTSFIDGMHTLSVRATDRDGASTVIGSRTVQIDNASLNLHPFGALDTPSATPNLQPYVPFGPDQPFGPIETPLDELTFIPTCNLGGLPCAAQFGEGSCPSGVPPADCFHVPVSIVRGWVLDVGAFSDFGQTGYVELLIDGVIIANTRRDCVVDPVGGAFENCYGVNRPDVERSYPGYVNSDNAGFVFDFVAFDDGSGHLAIGVPTPDGGIATVDCINPGKHTIEVRAGDDAETVATIGKISANFVTCVNSGDLPAFGYIDRPYNYEFISNGFSDPCFEIVGWADDGNLVDHVEIDIDGQVVCEDAACNTSPLSTLHCDGPQCIAHYGLLRADVPKFDPRVGGSQHTGFDFFLDTTKLTDGAHDLNVYVVDHKCIRSLMGRRKFVVNNNVPTHGP